MTAIDLRALINQPLEWRQPSAFQRVYELRVGDALLATLAKQGAFKSAYDVWTPEGQWIIRREGFWRTEFVVFDVGGGEIARGSYRGLSNKTKIRTIAGHEYLWKSTNFWGTQFAWCTPEGTPLVTFHKKSVTILPAAQGLPDLTLLAVIARYIKIYRDDAVAASAAAT